MKPLRALVERLRKISIPDLAVRAEVARALKEKIKTDIALKDISLRHGVVYIAGSNVLKSELFFKKTELLTLLKERLGKKAPRDIR